jgi:predicted secreted hydrolase
MTVSGRAATVRGTAWLDHEWSSEYLAPEARGWDWVGLNFDDGSALMAFRIRDSAGAAYWAGGALQDPGGTIRNFLPAQVRFVPLRRWRSPRTGIDYPVAFNVVAGDVDVTLEPLLDDQELDSRASVGTVYWEGAVRAFAGGREIGRGYLELTGYGSALKL